VGWVVGGVRITRVVEFVMPLGIEFFAAATPADVAAQGWLVPEFVDPAGRLLVSLHSYVLEVGGRRILVDTCVGNRKSRPTLPAFDQQDRPFLANLAAAGFTPETIDTVVCTHAHVDHVGWNTNLVDGRWVPTFPRARHLIPAADLERWAGSDDPLHGAAFADSVRPVIEAGLVDPVTGAAVVAPGVELRPTPGHTPGHQCVWIRDDCVITGDVLHHPIQCAHPDWAARGDLDPDRARATRRELLHTAAATGALVLGTHFAGTSAGRILGSDGDYRFAPEARPGSGG
jgi:glyoxylase-like metal-dependent hydrolase (beta-lactamase superfamily II)